MGVVRSKATLQERHERVSIVVSQQTQSDILTIPLPG
jgi:hypothetical protein